MNYSDAGLAITKHFEGLKLEAYQDQGGTWTIGYGHTNYVKRGQVITEEEAERLLRVDIKTAALCVETVVRTPLNQNQFDALVDWTFNLGCGRLRSSTLLVRLNSGDYEGAANEFKRWVYIGKLKSAGLIRRRQQNEKTFRTPVEVHSETTQKSVRDVRPDGESLD